MNAVWVLEHRENLIENDSVVIAVATSEQRLEDLIRGERPEQYKTGFFAAWRQVLDTTDISNTSELRFYTLDGRRCGTPAEAAGA